MRILLIAPHFAEYVVRLARALARSNDVELFVSAEKLRAELPAYELAQTPRLRITSYSDTPRRAAFLAYIRLYLRVLKKPPDIVHLQETTRTEGALFLIACRIFCRTVLTVHDPSPHEGRDSGVSIVTKFVQRMSRKAAHLLVAHGEFCARELARSMPRAIVFRSSHGEMMVPRDDQRRTAVAGRVLFFGRMEKYKGLETLLVALELLAARCVRYSIHLAGRGPELQRLRDRFLRLPAVDIDERFLTYDAAIGAFQDASVVVTPYDSATQSGVVAAALANGRPVIASRVGGLPDMLMEGVDGILVEPGDGVALANALEGYLTNRKLSEALENGAVASSTRSNWLAIGEDLTVQYAKVLKR